MEASDLTVVTGDNATGGRLAVPAQPGTTPVQPGTAPARPRTAPARAGIAPAQAGVVISTGSPQDAVERALAALARDPGRIDDLLDAVSQARLWVALPGNDGPVTDGFAVHLPTVRYLGGVFVPAYTSAARLLQASPDLAPGERATVLPHIIVGAADLARRLPPGVGIALNPGAELSVPVSPAGIAHLAAERTVLAGHRVQVGPLPVTPAGLLAAIAAGLGEIRAVREAAAAWLAVEAAGEGLVISACLDSPAAATDRDAVIDAVQAAVTEAGAAVPWPVDVTFPGEGEPDVIDRWVAACASPFYRRAMGLPAPRPASG
ncbi:MAG TPA: SseB family protein [Streptosporangiaceae bacterium]|nr:SseB family protein [Streptosporangiaceae bacterium]